MNKFIGQGYLGKNGATLKFTPGGVAVSTFSLAIKDFKKADADQTYTYINCVAWNKPAETLANNADRIKTLLVEGHLQNRSYDAKDGTKRYVTEIVIEKFEITAWKDGQEVGQPQQEDFGGAVPVDDGDIPF